MAETDDTHIGHVWSEAEDLGVLDLISNLPSRRRESLQMNRQHHWRLVNRKVFLCRDQFLASIERIRNRIDVRKEIRGSLFAFVFVGSLEDVDPNKLRQRFLDAVDSLYVE